MQSKKKTCSDCGIEKPIWKSYGKLKVCKPCSMKRDKPKPIPKESKKRAKENAIYRGQRESEPQPCVFPGCKKIGSERHHKAGKENGKLTDLSNQVYICREHHRLITEHTEIGVRLGISEWRHKKAS